MLKRLREPVSGLTHLGAAIAAAIGTTILLYLSREDIPKQLSVLVYGAALILMFAASACYHLINSSPQVIQRLRKFDHSAIYLLIAGTYTPICLQFFTGFWRWGLLAIIWSMALAGIIVKVFIINAPRWLTASIYLIMGWLSIMAIKQMLIAMPVGALVWLILGGGFFTIGAIIYITKKPDFYPRVFGFHEIWHIFVILGCLSHFIVITKYVALSAQTF
jgi:hemolysin III